MNPQLLPAQLRDDASAWTQTVPFLAEYAGVAPLYVRPWVLASGSCCYQRCYQPGAHSP